MRKITVEATILRSIYIENNYLTVHENKNHLVLEIP